MPAPIIPPADTRLPERRSTTEPQHGGRRVERPVDEMRREREDTATFSRDARAAFEAGLRTETDRARENRVERATYDRRGMMAATGVVSERPDENRPTVVDQQQRTGRNIDVRV